MRFFLSIHAARTTTLLPHTSFTLVHKSVAEFRLGLSDGFSKTLSILSGRLGGILKTLSFWKISSCPNCNFLSVFRCCYNFVHIGFFLCHLLWKMDQFHQQKDTYTIWYCHNNNSMFHVLTLENLLKKSFSLSASTFLFLFLYFVWVMSSSSLSGQYIFAPDIFYGG